VIETKNKKTKKKKKEKKDRWKLLLKVSEGPANPKIQKTRIKFS
jgi:hypothetical protein